MKFLKPISLALAALLLFFVGSCFYYSGPGGSGVIASYSLKDGGTVLVTQKWTAWVEPYQVSFWYKGVEEEEWLWNFIDQEQYRWHNVLIQEEDGGNNILVYEGDKLWLRFTKGNRPLDAAYGANEKALRTYGLEDMLNGFEPYEIE